ncbi:hypothetical protein FUA48_11130 [Flavobacterium alkalisoli]|uniref:Uncharacterized protein n=1 Tax=Flavobacterium alkalisoli TaxID=2602769 RepID=A0A5B9FYW9_9FLAO|nr:hypothetical protein [Flavobacterium alkalisoli]QEE50112.1 hypothetical protein FUA48_11130 [Flavobacterium alkalisoli]
MKQFFFTALFFFTANIIQAQEYTVVGLDGEVENAKPKLTDECEEKMTALKERFLKMYESPEAVNHRKLTEEFFAKVHNKEPMDHPRATNFNEKILFWIEAHLDQTDFSSAEEAKDAWNKKDKALLAYTKANMDYYVMLMQTMETCGSDTVEEFETEMRMVYGMY